MSAPGLFSSVDQVMKVAQEPSIQKAFYAQGEAKGLIGFGFAPIGPSSILTKKQVTKRKTASRKKTAAKRKSTARKPASRKKSSAKRTR